MRSPLSPENRDRTLRWLAHGIELAQGRHGAKATHRQAIWLLLTEALDLLDRIPDQEKRWLYSGTRSGGWGGVGLTRAEMEEIERLRVLSSMLSPAGRAGYMPQRDEVDRSLGVVEWLRWCSVGEDHSLQKAAVLLARGSEDAAVRAWSKSGRSRIRQAVYEIRTQVVGRILSGLKAGGIVPDECALRFVDTGEAV
ncbi:hypothetical protein [uncultured Methylobacterium sp.]|jgi:hypothetical protein|uniref:hypothetical protein n=1 Tax=uncultured Methylobacterium sp. TaxID=157278 RepID=UPI00262BA49F|nr:hypothetical protein [uncultured Methylobacterium sp.]